MNLTVVVPTHNPHPGRLARTLAGLRAQTLPASGWETIVVDNASHPAVDVDFLRRHGPDNIRVVGEPTLGLTAARRCGFAAAQGEAVVLVDDDNVLAPDYLSHAQSILNRHPQLGAAGGISTPEFEAEPARWVREFDGLLACRNLGTDTLIALQLWDEARGRNEYPPCSPIGAGMVLRRSAIQCWLAQEYADLTDRRGTELTSGGDNDIILTLLAHGWHVGYFPELSLTHLIPAGRIKRDYLARLNRGIAKSWIQVLTKHSACPWGAIPRWTVPLRKLKAWFHYRAWAGPVEFIRWQGACGHFEGQAAVARQSSFA